jgi:PAS domain-containing protein
VFWANIIFTAIYGSRKRLTGYAKVTKDIIENKKTMKNLIRLVHEKTKKLTNVLERITDGFVAFDTHWNYVYVNKKASEIIGRNPEELIGKNLWKEFQEKMEYSFYRNFYRAMNEQRTLQVEDYYPPLQMSFKQFCILLRKGFPFIYKTYLPKEKHKKIMMKPGKVSSNC